MTTDSVSSASFVNESVNSESPWLGLHPFTEELQEFFYGRESEADELQRRVNRKTLSVLFGQSGLGKTSLLRAGLFPRLRRAGFLPFTVRIVHMEDAPPPAAQIIAAFVAAAAAANAVLNSPLDASGTTLWEYAHHIDFSLTSATGKPLVPVVVFDQFEEVFTIGAESEPLRLRGAALLTELADLIENRPPQELLARFETDPDLVERFQFDRADYRVLLSLREDYLANLEDVRARMPSLSENRMRLARMNGEQALDAVSKPGGHLVSPSISRQIVRFVSGAPAADEGRADVDLAQYEVDPAMLSLFCAELNNRRRAQGLRQITSDLLAGSRDTILQDYYERCLADVHPAVRRFVEDELLTEQGYRVDVPLEKAQKALSHQGAANDALDALVKRRLLRIEERLHVRRVELTHDVLTSIVRRSRDERKQREETALAQQREEHIRNQLRKARRRLVATIIAATSIIAIIATGFYVYLDRWVWPHDAYYNSFVKRRGMIAGIGELSERDRAARTASFKITTIGRGDNARVTAMEAVNSYGELTAEHGVSTYLSYASESDAPSLARECRWEYIYDKDGRVVYEKAFDKHGRMVWCFVYSPTTRVTKSRSGDVETAHGHFIGEDGYPRPQRNSSAEYVEIQYSPEGWEHIRKYSDRNGRPQPGLDRAYGMLREYDDQGRLTKTVSLDEQGQPMIDSAGNCGLASSDFDALGNSRESVSLGLDGGPRAAFRGWTKMRQEYDEHGNNVATFYFDAAKQPVTLVDGYSGVLSIYDQHGQEGKRTYVDEQGKPTTANFGYAGWTVSFDDRGNEVERRYFGADEKPIRTGVGISATRYERDANGLITKQSFFDAEGHPTLSTEAIAGWKSEYDDQGLESRRSFFNIRGEPTLVNTENIAGWAATYDDRGNRVKRTSIGMDGRPSRNNKNYVTEEIKYDDFGNQIWVRYLDESGRPCKHKDGYAGYRAEYDGRGNRIKFLTFDESERPQSYEGIFGWTSEYDKLGNETARRYIDAAGNPAALPDGSASWAVKFDSLGHETERRYFNLAGKPAPGVAYTTTKYDQLGHALQKAYLDASGEPAPNAEGYTRIEYKYDAAGRTRKRTYFFEAHPHASGYSRAAFTLNDQGQTVAIEYQDAAGKPTRDVNRVARTEQQRNSRGLIARQTFFDPEGKPTLDVNEVAGWTAKYDAHGNEIERRFFDLAGKPTLNVSRVAGMSMKYDDHGNEIWRRFVDVSDKPTLSDEAVAGWTSQYDDRNHEIERQFFNVAEKPTPIKYGYLKWTARYNDGGKIVEKVYLDGAGQPAALTDGSSRVEYEYDEAGRERRRKVHYAPRPHADGHSAELINSNELGQVISRLFLDASGHPMRATNNIARAEFERDVNGRVRRESFFDENGLPTLSNEGIAGWASSFDDRGNELERQFFGTDGKPKFPEDSTYTRWTARYDDKAKLLEKAYFGLADEPATLNDGYNRIGYEYDGAGRERKRIYYYDVKPHADGQAAEEWTFNEQGQQIAAAYLDRAGRPKSNAGGFASVRYERDPRGRIERCEFLDVDGKPTLNNDEVAGWTSKYDGHGNEIEHRYFGVDGKPKLLKDARYAAWTASFNENGRLVDEAYFDVDDKPAQNADDITKLHHEYDQKGRRKSTICEYLVNPDAGGYRKSIRSYDDDENRTEMAWYDADGKPARYAEGYYRVTFEYNGAGVQTRKRFYFELAGEVEEADSSASADDNRKYPYAYVQEDYAGDRHTGTSYHHRDGRLATGPKGYAQLVIHYDDAGVARDNSYYDESETLIPVEVRISRTSPDSQSEKLGLQANDVLTTYDGQPVADSVGFMYRRRQAPADQGTKRLVVRRGAEELSVEVAAGELGVDLDDHIPGSPAAGD